MTGTQYKVIVVTGTGRAKTATVLAVAYSRTVADDIRRLVFGDADGTMVVEETITSNPTATA